jgi:hypothetical protein
MSPSVRTAIQRLRENQWFRAVGQSTTNSDVVRVSSWRDAERYSTSPEWELFAVEAANDLAAIGDRVHPDWPARKWNLRVEEIKKEIDPIIERRVTPLLDEQGVSKAIRACVSWDLVSYCQAVELSGEAPETLYLRIGGFYLAGHFPCGWIGEYPKGKLVVF